MESGQMPDRVLSPLLVICCQLRPDSGATDNGAWRRMQLRFQMYGITLQSTFFKYRQTATDETAAREQERNPAGRNANLACRL